MTQHEIIPMLIGFGLIIFFGLLIYYIRHLQNSHAKERARLLIQIGNLEDKFAGVTENCEYYKRANESLSDTKRLLDLELQDREQHEALIDQQNAMILELRDMVKTLIQKGKEADQVFIDDTLKQYVEGMSQLRAEEMERSCKILEEAEKNGTYTGRPDYVGFAKAPRPINSLKPTEVVQVNNEAERDAILELMGKEGWKWHSGVLPFEFKPNRDYPYVISYKWEHFTGIGAGSVKFHIENGDTILPASDFLPTIEPVEPQLNGMDGQVVSIDETLSTERDWSVSQAFPNGYEIPKGVRVVKVGEDDRWVRKGSVGVTIRNSSCPFVKWENENYNLNNIDGHWNQPSFKLAPLNPTDHPDHPQFKG